VWIQLVSDKRRFGMLCAALSVGLLLWARLIIVSKVPRTAVADEATVAAQTDQGMAAGSQRPTAKRSRTGAPLRVEFSESPGRDPFVINPDYFPQPIVARESDEAAPKLAVQTAEGVDQVEARRTTQLSTLADTLRLEAALGDAMAVINGRRVRPGEGMDVKDGSGQQAVFKLETIRQRSVILECEGRRYELQMAAPGD